MSTDKKSKRSTVKKKVTVQEAKMSIETRMHKNIKISDSNLDFLKDMKRKEEKTLPSIAITLNDMLTKLRMFYESKYNSDTIGGK